MKATVQLLQKKLYLLTQSSTNFVLSCEVCVRLRLPMESNAEEAERAKSEGRRLMNSGNFQRAMKMFEISQRLHPNPDTIQLLHSAKAAWIRGRGASFDTQSRPGTTSSTNSTNLLDNISQLTYSYLRPIIQPALDVENRYISAPYRPYLRWIVVIIVLLLGCKIILQRKLILFALPGDINYSSSNVIVHAPIVSCLLISFLFNAACRIFNQH